MPSAVQEARAAIAARLFEIRRDAGLTGIALAARTGFHRTKISKIEHGVQTPTADDIRTWCTHCGATDQIEDLVASLRAVEGMWVEWRRLTASGLRHLQEATAPLYERTDQFRIYEPDIVPGLFQTPDYARSLCCLWIETWGGADDVDQAVEARMARQRILTIGGRAFTAILEEQALYARACDAEVMAEQLAHLVMALNMPRVNLGIIPRSIRRAIMGETSFWIFDSDRVIVETLTARLTITQPREVALYARAFGLLSSMAVYGPPARRLIAEAIAALDR